MSANWDTETLLLGHQIEQKVLVRCEMQTLIGPIAITTIMLMCILTMRLLFRGVTPGLRDLPIN